MSAAEMRILQLFRRYEVGPTEMLFVNFHECRVTAHGFTAAMRRLIDKGLVIKERPQQAYSLTRAGYELSR
jgi:predicted transcriptional regulator